MAISKVIFQLILFKETRDEYFIVVIEDVKKQKIIGAASLIIEKKMIHSAAKVITF